jgi:predicted dienelactone hydrolase
MTTTEASKSVILGIALVSVASSLLGCGAILEGLKSQDLPAGSASEARIAPGPHSVESEDFHLVDTTRPTMANGEFPETDNRKLEVTVWSPAGSTEPAPLLVYGHGFTGSRTEMIFVHEHLASHGYIVAALDFPLTTTEAPGGANVLDLVSQPGDVRFVIDALLSGEGPMAEFAPRIDADRIAMAGLSYGGLTTTLLAYHPREGDRRIKAAISIAGPTQMFAPEYFRHGGPPFLMIAGTEDAIVYFKHNAAPVPELVPGGGLLQIDGGTHLGFVDFARTAFRFASNSDETVCATMDALEPGGGEESETFVGLDSPEDGIDFTSWTLPCQAGDEFGLAMRPARQQAIATLSVRAFLDSHFSEQTAQRQDAGRFLRETLPLELERTHFLGSGAGSSAAR